MLHIVRSPVSKKGMKLNNGSLFLQAELSSFYIRSQVISPPQSAALSTSSKSWKTKTNGLLFLAQKGILELKQTQ